MSLQEKIQETFEEEWLDFESWSEKVIIMVSPEIWEKHENWVCKNPHILERMYYEKMYTYTEASEILTRILKYK